MADPIASQVHSTHSITLAQTDKGSKTREETGEPSAPGRIALTPAQLRSSTLLALAAGKASWTLSQCQPDLGKWGGE